MSELKLLKTYRRHPLTHGESTSRCVTPRLSFARIAGGASASSKAYRGYVYRGYPARKQIEIVLLLHEITVSITEANRNRSRMVWWFSIIMQRAVALIRGGAAKAKSVSLEPLVQPCA